MGILDNAMQQGQPSVATTAETAKAPQAETATTNAAQENPKSIQKRFAMVAMKLIYDKAVSASLVEQLKAGANNPAQTTAQAALGILERMKKDVQGINPDLVFSVSAIVVIFILELAAASKAFEVAAATLKDSIAAQAELTKQGQGPPQTQGMDQTMQGAMPQQPMTVQ